MAEPFDVLLMDPPWRFDSTAGGGSRRDVGRQYDALTVDEVCQLSIRFNPVLAPISRCFLWVVDSQLEAGLRVLRAWGYEPKKIAFVWVKLSKRERFKTLPANAEPMGKGPDLVWTERYGWRGLTFGAGRTTRNGAEVCLLGARGSMPVASKSERQVILAPQREHSRKPEEAYERIEAMYPGRRYLELFARKRRRGWAAWGEEAPS